ncbi:MAG: hypothetical protein ACXVYY_18165 [Oryzihumus sp.]
MSDLRVDYGALEEGAATARALKSDFDGLEHRVSGASGIWGSDRIAAAMHTFGTNWSYHREVLSDEIEKTGEKLEKCLQTFQDTDTKVAEDLDKSMRQATTVHAGGAR